MTVPNATQQEISDILKKYKTVAVIGMSKNPEKDAVPNSGIPDEKWISMSYR